MYPTYRPRPQPNYALRRLVALTGLLVVAFLLYTIVGNLFGGGDGDSNESTAGASTTTTATTVLQLVAPPTCAAGDTTTVYAQPSDWARTIIDSTYGLPDDYELVDLVSSADANYAADFQIRSLLVEDLNDMRNAILEAGIPEVALLAAYRSPADQRDLIARVGAGEAPTVANDVTARPGHSEHQLGTSIDVRPIGASTVDDGFGDTETGQWLAENSWRYGFINTAPRGKESVTCFEYDPSHFRYIGVDLAGRVHESGLTLREYLWHWEATGSEPGMPVAAATSTTTTTAADE